MFQPVISKSNPAHLVRTIFPPRFEQVIGNCLEFYWFIVLLAPNAIGQVITLVLVFRQPFEKRFIRPMATPTKIFTMQQNDPVGSKG